MSTTPPLRPFQPGLPDPTGIISWVHIGDLHITGADQQNILDLTSIVDEINQAFAGSVSFAYIPGDVADGGKVSEYQIARNALDRLRVPWCSIIGDHDVHEKTYDNYLSFMAHEKHYAFNVGPVRFLALNAFDIPDPGSFCLLENQLNWVEAEIEAAGSQQKSVVLLLHCYPTDLKQGGDRLRQLVAGPSVRLIDMGHTHYNEIANDGKTLYTATRSTGQIEEGPVGFSITNIDRDVISWKFLPLHSLPAVMITSPADERLITGPAPAASVSSGPITVRAKAWASGRIRSAVATLAGHSEPMSPIAGSNVWQVDLRRTGTNGGFRVLTVTVTDDQGRTAEDTIRVVADASAGQSSIRAERDQDNALGAWPERGLLGTQLGPNKNGRKW